MSSNQIVYHNNFPPDTTAVFIIILWALIKLFYDIIMSSNQIVHHNNLQTDATVVFIIIL